MTELMTARLLALLVTNLLIPSHSQIVELRGKAVKFGGCTAGADEYASCLYPSSKGTVEDV